MGDIALPTTGTGDTGKKASTVHLSNGADVQNVQLVTAVESGAATPVSSSNPMGVAIVGTVPISGAPTTVTANLGTIGGAATQTTLAAVLSALGTPLQAGGSVAVTSSALPTGAALDATLTGGTQKSRITDGLGIATNAAGSGFLKVTDEPRQVFYDPFDAALDTANVWTSTQGSSGVAAAVATGVMSMGTGTTANGYSKLISIPTFKPPIPGWVVYSDAIALPDGAAPVANSYRFWGAGTTPATPTAAAPVTDGYGFEMTTAGHLCCVVYAGGARTLIADLNGGAQPTNANYHRYIVQVRTDKTYFYIDTIDNAGLVATTSFNSSQQQILPKLFLAVGNSTPPVSNTQIQCTGAVVSDTGKNATQIADGTFPWRRAQVDSTGKLQVGGTFTANPAADTRSGAQTISATGSTTLTGLNGCSTLILEIQPNTATGVTSILEGSIDGLIWDTLGWMTSLAGNAGLSQSGLGSAAGVYTAQIAGFAQVRFRVAAISTGSFVINLSASAGVANTRTTSISTIGSGSSVIGKVSIDQTTPGTTNLVAANQTQLAGTAVAVNAGSVSAGTQRVVEAASVTPTQTSVAASATSVSLLASNTSRMGATFYNEPAGAILYLKLGATASTTSYTIQIAAGGYYELPYKYNGAIDGIWASASGNVRITEIV